MPSRTASDSVQHFETAYRPGTDAPSGYFDSEHKAQIVGLELNYLTSVGLAGRRLIDIGGGSGAFAVAAAARDWVVSTVDPALDPGQLANAGVKAYKGFLSALPAHEKFDVATLWDVIEHVEDPLTFLQEVKACLSPQATIVLSTGNYKSVDRVAGGREHWIYQLDHRWYFSPESMSRLLKLAGYEVFSSCNRVLRPGWAGQEQHRGPTLQSLLSSLVKKPFHALQALRLYQRLQEARHWPQSGLAIFTVAARSL